MPQYYSTNSLEELKKTMKSYQDSQLPCQAKIQNDNLSKQKAVA
jgi:hypothetical protein